MRIAFGCDHAGFPHKDGLIEALQADGQDVLDMGTFSEDPVDYPDFARAVANAVRNRFVDTGVLLCGSEVGAAVAANKIRGIRAAAVHDEYTARQSRTDDDANVICLGARVIDVERCVVLVREFLATPFSNEEGHIRRIAKIADLESGLAQVAAGATRARPAAVAPATAPAKSKAAAAPPPPPEPAEPEPVAAPEPAAKAARAATVAPPGPAPAARTPEPARERPAPPEPAAAPKPPPKAPPKVEPKPEPEPEPQPVPVAPAATARKAARAESLEEVARVAAATVNEREAAAPAEDVLSLDDAFRTDPTTLAPAQAALQRFESMDFAERIWVKDATLWSEQAETQALIRNRLGWLTSPTLMKEYAGDLKTFATEIRRLGYSNVLLIGMGGSSLAPDVMNRTFGSKMGFPDLAVLDSTDPLAVKNALARLQLSRTLFVISSKSGSTTEVNALYRFFRAQVEAGKPPKPGQNFIAITDPGSPLEKLAKEANFRRTFLNHPSIGGRFSALSFFGLVPAALIGVDIDKLLERAGEMVAACDDSVPVRENAALVLGALLAGFALKGRDKVTLVLSEKIATFGLWLEQLLAESTGKDGKGLVPVDHEPLGPPTVYGADRLFVSLSLAGEAPDPGLDALDAAGHPVYRLTLRDAYDLGAEFFRWELATAAAGSLLGVNPLDEPNVAHAKEATQAMLAAYKKSKRLPDWPVDREEDGILLLSNTGSKPASVSEGVAQFLWHAKPGDYVALLAYLTPEHETTEALQALRLAVRDRLRVATTAGYGPRYLHSTGQLHKGGPATVLAIELTGDDRDDLPIPGEGYGFSVLKAAQAIGDLETLRKAGRRVIRLHFGGRAAAGIEKVAAMVRKTVK
jgi:RpiB/LacA/LacB family sugar-phosphate isomerase